jgi:hypothetical protein
MNFWEGQSRPPGNIADNFRLLWIACWWCKWVQETMK